MTHAEASRILQESIGRLLRDDRILLTNDVSERAITHKLAEYLQLHVPQLNVDCEYNRNFQRGPGEPKFLNMLKHQRSQAVGKRFVDEVPEEELKAYSTFPDIIIHHRGDNDSNCLVIEAKKVRSTVHDSFDKAKLCGFTESANGNEYCYEHGVLIKFETRVPEPVMPTLTWFRNGAECRV